MTGIEGASKEARRRATCASIRLQKMVSATPIMIASGMRNVTHRRGRSGGGGGADRGLAALDFALAFVLRGPLGGPFGGPFGAAFLAFLTGMMRGNDYSL